MLRSIALQTLRKTQLQTTLQLQPQQQRQQQQCQRLLVTAAQKKRALNDDQVYKGSTTTSTNTTSGNSSSSSSGGGAGSGGSGGGSIVPIVALVSAAAVGGAYYMDMIPANVKEGLVGATSTNKGIKEEKKDLGSSPTTPTEKTVASSSTPTITTTPTTIDKTTKEKDPVHDVETTKEEKESVVVVGNRVINIQAPPTTGRKSNPVQPVQHNPKGSRVSVEKFNTVYGSQEPEVTESNEKEDEVENSIPPSMSTIIQEAEKELLTSSSSGTSTKIDEALKQAHVTMRATLDETFLRDLEKLSEHELRIRIVQLASEMGERTKWEAVRLREFLSMKEKEVADKFLELMQKQRLEFEDLLARRLREQEFHLTKEANDAIEAKEKSFESVIEATANAQQAEHDAALKNAEERLEREIGIKYESEFGQKLAEAKASFVKEMEEKIAMLEELSKRLETTEQNLEISRNFESGSQKAHRISAAALALAEKMETSKGAMVEFVALKSIATENGVIAAALEKIPNSVNDGIPTLPELQAAFEHTHKITRQAAYVPSGHSGVEGQLAGMVFANLSVQPSPDSVSPSESGDSDIPDAKMSDFILARAKQYVKLGQLEDAVNELDKLKGQASFTVNDWKRSAIDRIAVDQALKVIKLECALMNKNMAG